MNAAYGQAGSNRTNQSDPIGFAGTEIQPAILPQLIARIEKALSDLGMGLDRCSGAAHRMNPIPVEASLSGKTTPMPDGALGALSESLVRLEEMAIRSHSIGDHLSQIV